MALAYSVFAILLLRGVYSDFDSGDATLGEVDDRLDIHNVAVWVTFVVVVAALVTWAVAAVTMRRGTKAVGLAGMVVYLRLREKKRPAPPPPEGITRHARDHR